MSEFMPRNKFNEHLSDKEFERRRRKAYLRELASIASDGSREDTNKIAKELEAEEYWEQAEREGEERKKNRMTEEDLDKLVDELFAGGGEGIWEKKDK